MILNVDCCRPVYDQRRRPNCITNLLMLLVMIIVILSVTTIFRIRYGQAMTVTPVPVGTTADGASTDYNRGKIINANHIYKSLRIPFIIFASTLNVIDNSTNQEIKIGSLITGTDLDDIFVDKLSISRRIPPTAFISESTKLNSAIHHNKNSTAINDEYKNNEPNINVDKDIYQMNNRYTFVYVTLCKYIVYKKIFVGYK